MRRLTKNYLTILTNWRRGSNAESSRKRGNTPAYPPTAGRPAYRTGRPAYRTGRRGDSNLKIYLFNITEKCGRIKLLYFSYHKIKRPR